MKHFFTLLSFLPLLANAQGLVSYSPMNRTVLLEEFAAIHCGNCPAGHAISSGIFAAHPDDVVGVEIHGGSLAVPSGNQPDFRTVDGAALWSQYAVAFQPQGMVNRQGLISTSNYVSATNATLALPSPVNIGLATSFDSNTGLLLVDVELYYTADGSGANDRIYVLLTQDHIVGYQQDYVNGAQANYDHRHVLRTYISDRNGDEVMTNSAGTNVVRNYGFAMPTNWDIEDCAVVAFVGEPSLGSTPGVIYQARSVNASGGATTSIVTTSDNRVGQAYPVPAVDLVSIPLADETGSGVLLLRDATGRVVRQERIASGQRLVLVDVSDLGNGIYYYGLVGERSRSLIVVR